MMNRAAKLAALRAHIAKKEQLSGQDWPVAPLGIDGLDTALPGGGLPMGAVHEFAPASYADFPAALGFGFGVLKHMLTRRPGRILFVLTGHQNWTEGMLYPSGLIGFGIDPDLVVQVSVPKVQNVLWTLEEALGHSAVSTVVGLLPANDRSYDFTASRRLALRAAEGGVTPLIVTSRAGFGLATAAETRWTVASAPSAGPLWRGQSVPGLGPARWQAELSKSRKGLSGQWIVEWEHETFSFRLAAPLGHRAPLRRIGAAAGQRAAS